jgi:competence protein ComEA
VRVHIGEAGVVPDLTRSQLAVYAAIAIAVLLLGARAIRAEGDSGETASSFPLGSEEGALSFDSGSRGDVVVDVTGAVVRPGVYRLPSINRAARLADGQQVVVPKRALAGSPLGAIDTAEGPISLGTATIEQLDTIEGIGPVTAEKIVEFRDQRGGLASVDQLDQVSGIGPATMDSLRSRLQP